MNGTVMLIIYVVLFGGIFYFLAIRPQRRQKQQHQEMVTMLKRGDEVVTIGGEYGTVRKVGPDWVVIEIAPRTQVKYMKRAISSITTPDIEEEEEYAEEEEYEEEYQDDEAAELEAGDEDGVYDEEEEYEEEYDEGEAEEYAEDEALEEEAREAPVAPAAGEPPKGKRA